MTTTKTALVIDDEPDIRELLQITLERMDVDCLVAENISMGKKLIKQHEPSICLTDMRLPDGNGIEFVEWLQLHAPGIPVAIITAHGNVETAVQALKAGAFDFISKPLDLNALRGIVAAALKLDEKALSDDAGGLLGDSVAMRHVREMIARVARSQAPVHISGESGTGKELVAQLIHRSGSRTDMPFVPVNCGAIPTELMESEFFGHKKGSFTGANSDKQGLFQSADGGTLFLDEVADLPFHMQVKLLRVIQEKAVRPVGAAQESPVDVRILSATHRNLGALVTAGKFREDLYYRINVIELPIPSLRERTEDIPELAECILEKLADELKVKRPVISQNAMERLLRHDYPGNVRELENVLERAITLSHDQVINNDDIQLRQSQRTSESSVTSHSLPSQVDGLEKQAILDALKKTRYNKTKAAKLLGMTLRQLRYRIEKLDIKEQL